MSQQEVLKYLKKLRKWVSMKELKKHFNSRMNVKSLHASLLRLNSWGEVSIKIVINKEGKKNMFRARRKNGK